MPHHTLRAIERRTTLLGAAAALLIASSCSHDSTSPVQEQRPFKLSRAVVSSPVPIPNSLIFHDARQLADSGTPAGRVAYVSMQPGSVPSGVSVSIQRQGDAAPATTVPMIDGGFDPVAIVADVNDTLLIVTRDVKGDEQPGIGLVVRRKPPSVVRTTPAAQRTDVPLNTGVLIVFTEPMDSASVVNGITLQLKGVIVPSTVSLSTSHGGAIQVSVRPVGQLYPDNTYDLVISTSVLNLLGESMAEPVIIPFTTQPRITNPFGDLTIESFSMIEYRYDDDDQYYYAPSLVVYVPASAPTVHIAIFELGSMTNFPINPNSDECTTTIDIAPGQRKQLFHELYGDYPLSYWWPGHRPTQGPAYAKLSYRSGDGPTHSVTMQGGMTPGSLPTSYSGGQGHWYSCAYGPQ